jgi:preprotein translocase subunit SecG
MYTFVLTLHVILSALLVLIILMQPGKGGDVSAAFAGGASTQLFGAAGPGNFLTKGTGIIATLFMVTSITLALYSTDAVRSGGGDVTDDVQRLLEEGEAGSGFGTQTAPATPGAAPTQEPAAPTTDPGAPVAPQAPAAGEPSAPAPQNP